MSMGLLVDVPELLDFVRVRSVRVRSDMTSCGVVCNSLVVGCVRAVTLGWSRALGFIPAFIFRLLW